MYYPCRQVYFTAAGDWTFVVEENVLADTLRVINSLEAEGVIGRYAIGGAIALINYTETMLTDDLDIFCHLPQAILLTLAPIYARLRELGYQPEGEAVEIEGVSVQFLVPPTTLVEEALDQAVETEIEAVSTRIFPYEHLLAIMAETNRPRDRVKLVAALDSQEPDESKLHEILRRHNLLTRWTQIVPPELDPLTGRLE